MIARPLGAILLFLVGLVIPLYAGPPQIVLPVEVPAIVVLVEHPHSAALNLYAYCDGDPVNRSDPSGLDWIWNGNDWDWITQSETFSGQRNIQKGDYANGYFDPPEWDGTNGELITVHDLTRVRNSLGGHVGGGSQRQYDQFYVSLIGTYGRFDGDGIYKGWSTGNGGEAASAFGEFHGVMSMPEIDLSGRRASNLFDDIQGLGDLAGQIPVVGEPVDLANALVYALRGKTADAVMSAGGAVPIAGNFVTGGKIVAKNADEAAALMRVGDRAESIVRNAEIVRAMNGMGGITKRGLAAIEAARGEASLAGKVRALRGGEFTVGQRRWLVQNFVVCFVAGTQVQTPEGGKPIEAIREGDMVLSRDVNSGEQAFKRVTRTYINETDETIVVVARANGVEMTLQCTPEHPFWSPSFEGWTEAGNLEAGMSLRLSDGNDAIVTRLEHKTHPEGESILVYNIEVEGWHTYFVAAPGENQSFILVHNTCEGHHFFLKSYGSNIPYGSKLLTNLVGPDHVALHRAMKNFLMKHDLHTYGGKNARTGPDLVNKYGEQHFFNKFSEFYKQYNGGSYYDKYIQEVREAIAGGYLRGVVIP